MNPSLTLVPQTTALLCAHYYTKGGSSWICTERPHPNKPDAHHFITTKDTHLPLVRQAIQQSGIERLTQRRPLIRRHW